jgi:hypothetical protein
MKVSSLFNLLTDMRDLLDFFEGVETTDQLVSRLERLKRQGTDSLLDCIYAANSSSATFLDDTLEISPLNEPDDEDSLAGELGIDDELEGLDAEEKQNPPDAPAPESEKT